MFATAATGDIHSMTEITVRAGSHDCLDTAIKREFKAFVPEVEVSIYSTCIVIRQAGKRRVAHLPDDVRGKIRSHTTDRTPISFTVALS